MIKIKFRSAFTIVELIVVISVIAILVGITLVAYGGWRTSVASKAVQSDLKGVASAMENARNFGSGYPLSLPAGFAASSGVVLTLDISSTTKAYCIDGTSSTSATIIYYIDSISKNDGPQAGTCAGRPIPPVVPTGLAITTTTDSVINLSWQAVSGATGYNVQCAMTVGYAQP